MAFDLIENETSLVAIEREYDFRLSGAQVNCNGYRVDEFESDLDSWDFAICMAAAMMSAFVATSEDLEKWMAGVHDAASESSGSYDGLQKMLGKLLHHKGDNMDMFSTRDGDDPWRLFHRLFFGHDILGKGGEFTNDNPFVLLARQAREEGNPAGLGVLQAVRHLTADTFSKQGLPMPGSSYFDIERNGRPWNSLIDIVQSLSKEAYGDKRQAEALYEHLFTIRAQDSAGGMLAKAVTAVYTKARSIEDDIGTTQIRLLAYTMSFYAQAIVGAAKQKGVPYVNTPLGCAMAKEFAALLIKSNKKTIALGRKTKELHVETQNAIAQHGRLSAFMSGDGLEMFLEDDE